MGPAMPYLTRCCLILTAGFALSALAFSLLVPVYEAPDEPSHVAVARYILNHRTLPVQAPGFPLGQEASQPPLYYVLGAALLALAPEPRIAPSWGTDHNPHVTFDRTGPDSENRNLFAHPNEQLPYRGDILGIHLMRLLSLGLGTVTVAGTVLLAAELFPAMPGAALLAGALVGFNPQFVFISGVFNNDAGIAAASTLTLWLAVRRLGKAPSWLESGLLGLGLGAGLLMKLSGLALVGLVGATLVLEGLLFRRSLRRLVAQGTVIYGAAGLVAGWWFLRNQVIYGDPLGWNMLLAASAQMIRPEPAGVAEAARLVWDARGSFWGLFGWSNVPLPGWFYTLTDLLVAAGLAGLAGAVRTAWIRRDRVAVARIFLVLGWFVTVAGALVRWVQLNSAAHQGRLLFPAIAAVGVALGAGLAWLAGRSAQKIPVVRPLPLTLLGCGLNLAVLGTVILPAYRPVFGGPEPVEGFGPIRFGDGIELVGVRVSPGTARPGDTIEVELWWRGLKPLRTNWSVSLVLLDPEQEPVVRVDSWPQGGRAPTSLWPPGTVVPDRYRLVVSRTAPSPEAGTVWIALYDAYKPTGPRLEAFDADGHLLGNTVPVARVRLKPAAPAKDGPTTPIHYRFGSAIRLSGYDASLAGGRLTLVLYWRAEGSVDRPFNVFFHVIDAEGRIVAQADGPPARGRYPTDLWEPGDVVADPRAVDLGRLPPGEYRVRVGLYSLEDGRRLPTVGPDGLPAAEDAAEVYRFRIP